MADEQNELKSVDWGDIFAFTRVFKGFRLALNLSNMALGLATVILICAAGMVADKVASLTGQTVMPGEIANHSRLSAAEFAQARDVWEKNRPEQVVMMRRGAASERNSLAGFTGKLKGRLRTAFANAVEADNKKVIEGGASPFKALDRTKLLEEAKEDWASVLGVAEDDLKQVFRRADTFLGEAADKADEAIDKDANLADDDAKDEAHKTLQENIVAARGSLTEGKTEARRMIESIRGLEIFDRFVAYEGACLKGAVSSLLQGSIAEGLTEYREDAPVPKAGFIVEMLRCLDGVLWLFGQHWLYASVLGLFSLAVWALFGGAAHRVAAVQGARDEKISIKQALRFAWGKFPSFFFAPLMPLAMIFGAGLLLMLGGLLTNVPFVGPIVVGVLFFLALLLGLLIAFLLIGLVAGGGLMFPTIAVESSDCFDAMSRSFSYVLSRPWRAALYGIAALVHGSICYVFVRIFAFLALATTHFFVRGAVWTGGDALPNVPDADTMDVLWATPTFRTLHAWNWDAMGMGEAVGATFVMLWVYLIIGAVAAFALSYLAGSTTMIYFLLRRNVDATELDDIVVEDEQEEYTTPETTPAEPVDEPAAEAEPEDKAEAEDAEATDEPDDKPAPAKKDKPKKDKPKKAKDD